MSGREKLFLLLANLLSPALIEAVPVTFISPDQIGAVPFSITSPGKYVLTDDVAYSTAGGTAITINASDVTLDLNGKSIVNSGGGTVTGVSLAGTFTNIKLTNGTLRVFSGSGIAIPAGSSDLLFDNIAIIGVSTTTGTGFKFAGTVGSGTRTSAVLINNCYVSNCARAITGTAVDAVTVRASTFNANGGRGIDATDCKEWNVDSCQVSFNGSATEGIGVILASGNTWKIKNSDFSRNAAGTGEGAGLIFQTGSFGTGGHSIENCTLNNNSSSSGAGIGLDLQSTNSCNIKNCVASGNSSSTSNSRGINITGTAIVIDSCVASGNVAIGGAGSAVGLQIGTTSTAVVVTKSEFNSNTALGTGAGIGASVDGRSHFFERCDFNSNAALGGGTAQGIFLQTTALNCVIRNCTAGGNTTQGMRMDAASGKNLFVGNISFGQGASNYSAAIPFLSIATTGPYPVTPTFDERDLANLSFT